MSLVFKPKFLLCNLNGLLIIVVKLRSNCRPKVVAMLLFYFKYYLSYRKLPEQKFNVFTKIQYHKKHLNRFVTGTDVAPNSEIL
jgi:hypothetical protein